MKKLFTSFVLALVSYSMVVGQCNTPVSTIAENFDASTNLPNCWTVHSRTGSGLTYVLANAGYAVSGANSLRMGHGGGSGSDVLYAVMPMTTNASGELSFYARTDGNLPIEIGTMSSANDTASFVPFQTVSPVNSYQLFTISMGTYSGTNQYIAFRYNMPSGSWTVLDNINYVENAPNPCLTPINSLVEDFDSYASIATTFGCWTTHASAVSGSNYILDNVSYATSGTKSLRMGHSITGGNATLFAVTPKLAAVNGILTFQARTDGGNPLIIGTMPTAMDTASFTAFDTIFHINAYQQFTIDFSSYVGTDSFIVFKYQMPSGNWTVLDDINYSIGTAISTIVEHQTLNIYPNPASTTITLDTKEIIESVSIYNLNGQLVKFVAQAENIIDIQDLPKGLYIVQAQTEKGIYQNKMTKN